MMQKLILIPLLALLTLNFSAQAKDGWMLDAQAAIKKAQKEKKFILLNFGGSGWCSACELLEEEVYSQPAFKEYAAQNLVPVELDFDEYARPRSKEFAAQHESLRDGFRVRGFPTVVLLTPEGKYMETTGYLRGGSEAYVAHLEELLKSHMYGPVQEASEVKAPVATEMPAS